MRDLPVVNERLCAGRYLAAPGLGGVPEGRRRVHAIRNLELAVLYFPFRQTSRI